MSQQNVLSSIFQLITYYDRPVMDRPLYSSFFPRLFSAVRDWTSTILSTHDVALVRI